MLTLTFAFLGGIGAFGQDQRLVVWLKDGEKVFFDLTERPKTTFGGTDIIISTSTLTANYPLERVLRYTYEQKSSGIENSNVSKPIRISQNDDNLFFENLHRGTHVQLFSTDGRQLSSYVSDGEKTIVISLSSHPSGVYIVKADDIIYKIMKQ